MARQHAWEAGTSWVAEGAIRFLLGGSDEARRLLAANEFHFLPLCDPDGVSGGQVRFNANGYDLNRNWDVDDAGRMPEIAALKRAILAGPKPDVFLAIHNTESVDYIAGALDRGGERVRGVGAFLNSSLNQETYFHAPAGARNSADEPAAGRMTAPEWVFRNTGAPAFLMELMVDTNPKLGRPVETRERIQLGAALARILAASVSQPSL
jgi:hypothetical protein